ncbi:mitochondrial fission protein ELM1-like [Rutidosis leptorrhynchoides]|uniref:mitochondrial fission protein ELM1-like n=1 Tax=Rutidosis leptorrhynchoides TaxID=125765 RepID=UPI003A99668F
MAILYAQVARGTTVLAEFSAVSGNTGAVARRILEKLPAEVESRLWFSPFYLSYYSYGSRVTRPSGGINEWLHWLPVSVHKQIYYIIKLICRIINGSSVGLSSILEADIKSIVTMARGTSEKDEPILVVACGRDTISIASSIKRLSSENVFVVQIQYPRTQVSRFDLAVTPQHDYYALTPQTQEQVPKIFREYITPDESPNKNVVLTVGVLHQVDSAALRSAANTWHDEFAPLPKPMIVVSIGGPSSRCRYGVDLAKQLTTYLHGVLYSCGSVRVSFSRRTPDKISNIVRKELGDIPKVYVWDGEEPNPHMGHLARADALIATADSVSMLSEACSTGKPVYVVGAERCKWIFGEFHRTLREKGLIRPFTGLRM